MAGEKQRHRLVAQLLVRHAAAVAFRILRGEHHRQKIPSLLATRALAAPLGDQPIDRRVQPAAGPSEAARVRQRKAIEQLHARDEDRLKEPKDFRERASDLIRFRIDVGIEQRARDDGQR
jgi:hypothetical protein